MFPRPGEIEEFPFFQAMSEDPVLYLSDQHMNEVLTLMALMESEAQENKLWHYDIIRSYLLIMFTKLRRLHQSRPQEGTVIKQHSLVNRFKSLVNQHYLDDKSVQSFARALNVTDRRLNEALRHATGKTATLLIHERIILEAKRQLMQSDLSIAQIAYNLKFEDPGYFSRFFKKNVSLTPVQFKNKFLGLQRPNASIYQKIP
jgi:AraC-like DNA-binding protein